MRVTCSLTDGITCISDNSQIALAEARAQEFTQKQEAARKAAQRQNITVKHLLRGTIYYKVKHPYATDCVRYLRSIGVYVPQPAYAYYVRIKTTVPYVGAVIVTREGSIGHFGLVIAVENGLVHIQDGNYDYGYETKRTLPINSSLIRGYL